MSLHARMGDFDRRITIQQRSVSQDTYGQRVVTWTTLLSCWADIQPMASPETVQGEATLSVITHQIVVLYRASITAAMRVLYQGRVLDIMSVVDDSMNHELLTLMCTEGLTQG